MRTKAKQLLSIILSLTMLICTMPLEVMAQEDRAEAFLPEAEIGEDILDHDVFYLGSTNASVPENGNGAYLIKVGRGGTADSESVALVKIADMTAKYGKDYVVRVHDERTKVNNPRDNQSLKEKIEGSDFDQYEGGTEEELAEKMEDDPEAAETYKEGVESAVDYLEEASGLKDKYGDENPYSDEVAKMYSQDQKDDKDASDKDASDGVVPADGKEEISINGEGDDTEKTSRVQEAANLFTGQDAEAQRLTAEGDALQDLQSVANVMTNAVVGASVELTFAPGESEKYLEVIPKDNTAGEGNRMFYMILGAPSGTTTNSAASTCAFTIIDNEEQEPAEVNFSSATYKHVPGEDSVTVTVKRSGAMNSVVSTKVKTTGKGSAKAGRDYSEVDTELVFPFGVDHLTVTIPVRTEYLKGKGDFKLALEPDAGCDTGKIAETTVTLKGTYSNKLSMQSSLSADQTKLRASAAQSETPSLTSSSTSVTKNNLSTYKTLDSVDIKNPANYFAEGDFNGKNYYEESTDSWRLTWEGDRDGDPEVTVIYSLTDKIQEGLFFSGAEVDWDRSNACSKKATLKTAIGGDIGRRPSGNYYWLKNFRFMWGDSHNVGIAGYWFPYDSSRDFNHEVRKMYPNKVAVTRPQDFGGDHPMAIEIMNIPGCEECTTLRIHSVKPILRPFQVNVKNADPLKYLQEDGTYAADTKAIGAEIVDGGNSAVFFMNDNVTVRATTEVGVTQYGYLSGLELLSGKDEKTPIGTIAENDDPAENSITYQLAPDALYSTLKSNGYDVVSEEKAEVWTSMLRENKYALKDDGYATYALFNVKPSYSYMDSSVKLRNPYDFPVTMTVSGTDYTLDAGETREVTSPDGGKIHKGDTIAVSKITLGNAGRDLYTPVGVRYSGKFHSTDIKATEGTFDFVDNKSIYISGSGDRRLNFSEIVVEPNLQEKDNHILVRVKTADLSKFDTESESAGFLKQSGTEEGGYTYFTYADKDATISGRLYAITATPTDPNYVAVWYDRNTQRKYEGNTLYFTAGGDQSRNMIDLSVDRSKSSVTLQGSLNYTNYNLRTGFAGNTSQVPAVGATLAAGSAGGMANDAGFITAGPIPSSSLSDRYLRYILSVNGNDQVREILLPSGKTNNVNVDISDSFSAGVSPVTSEIFRNTGISAEMTNSAYKVDGGQIPTILGESVDMSVSIKPTTYTYSYFGKNGKLIEKEEDEYPVSVQFIVYDKNDVFRGTYEPVSVENAKFDRKTRAYRFDSRLDFVASEHAAA